MAHRAGPRQWRRVRLGPGGDGRANCRAPVASRIGGDEYSGRCFSMGSSRMLEFATAKDMEIRGPAGDWHALRAKPGYMCDEIWNFIYAKDKQKWHLSPNAPEEAGTIWLWIALCSKTRLIIDWKLGDRSTQTAVELLQGVKSRLANTRHIQIATDGHSAYTEAIPKVFGKREFHAQLIKPYSSKRSRDGEERNGDHYPRSFGLIRRNLANGLPEEDQPNLNTTAYLERQNLNIRMYVRRYTRRSNGFSKRLENHAMAVALYITYYNFARMHEALKGQSPAMAAGLVTHLYDTQHIVKLLEEYDSEPGPRGPYRKTRERLAAEGKKKRKKRKAKPCTSVGVDSFEYIRRPPGPPRGYRSRRHSSGPPAHVLKRSRQKKHEQQLKE